MTAGGPVLTGYRAPVRAEIAFALSGPGISQELTTYQVALWQGGRKRSDPARLTTPGKESFPTGRTGPIPAAPDKGGRWCLARYAVQVSRPRHYKRGDGRRRDAGAYGVDAREWARVIGRARGWRS